MFECLFIFLRLFKNKQKIFPVVNDLTEGGRGEVGS